MARLTLARCAFRTAAAAQGRRRVSLRGGVARPGDQRLHGSLLAGRRYAVVRRTREIGIRFTLGAPPAAVVRAVLGRVAIAIRLGVVAGLAGGAYFSTFVRTLLYEVEPLGPASFVLPVLGLLAVGASAAWFPAKRATRVDPAEALRME